MSAGGRAGLADRKRQKWKREGGREGRRARKENRERRQGDTPDLEKDLYKKP
jgi:hypothetical protein